MAQELSWKEAALVVLQDAKEPMTAQEIVDEIVHRGLHPNTGATPAATVGARIHSSIKEEGAGSPFIRPMPGRFALRGPGQFAASSQAPEDLSEKEPQEGTSQVAVQRLALAHRHYGYRRIAVLLQREGYVAGAKTVRRLMREDSLLAIRRRRFVVTTNSDHRFQVWPNLAQYLELTDINQLWVADLTFLRLEEEFAYLAVVLDAYSRRVIGWALGKEITGALTVKALEKALELRHPLPGFVHHSDQGSQYACVEYVDLLERHGAVLSMTLKQEEIDARPYRTMDELAGHIEEFIEQVYNSIRLHSALDYRSPVEFEQQCISTDRSTGWLPARLSFPRHRESSSDVLDQAQLRRDES